MNPPRPEFNIRSHASWGVLVLLTLLALSPTASSAEGILLAAPPLGPTILALGALGVLWWLARGQGTQVLGFLPVLLALAVVPFLPGVRALSGPPLFGVVLGGAAMALVASGARPPRWLFFPAVLVLYLGCAYRVQRSVGPEGDEPHYLMVADSVLRDGDLSLEDDYTQARYAKFYRGATLAPHYRVRGREGRIYSLHAVGLSILILPAYGLGGYAGASLFLALLGALLAREIRRLVADWSGSGGLAEGVGWVVALSPPLLHYAGLIFTEVPAGLVIAAGLRRGRHVTRLGRWGLASWVGSLALLPWLNVRYAPLAVLVAAYGLSRWPGWRRAVAVVALGGVSAVAIGGFHYVLYGFFDPRLVYGRRPEFALETLATGLPGLLLDQEFGLLAYAPVFALGLLSIPALFSWGKREGATVVLLVGVVLLTAGSWHMWRGGFNPAARFLVPLLAPLALVVAAALRKGAWAAAYLLVGFSVFVGLAGAVRPQLTHRDRDGTAPFYRSWAGAEEWTRLLPGYVLEESSRDRTRLAVVWVAGLTLAAWPRRRPAVSAAGAGLASVGFLAILGLASTVSTSRTGGRERVHVLGNRTLELPSLRTQKSASARWDSRALLWGPVFEPHRHPGGAEVGSRLPLKAGRYEIRFEGAMLGAAPPDLRVESEPAGWGGAGALERTAEGLRGCLAVAPGTHAVTLKLIGGSPLILKDVSLAGSTFCEPLGLTE